LSCLSKENGLAYEVTMMNTKVMYVGMKSGKKFFLDIKKDDFEKLIEPVKRKE